MTAVNGYRKRLYGSRGSTELFGLIRIGDTTKAVNEVSRAGKSFTEIVFMSFWSIDTVVYYDVLLIDWRDGLLIDWHDGLLLLID